MWRYEQETGKLSHNGSHVVTGYSGRDWGKNNPDAERVRGIGPIPAGRWKIVGPPYNSPNVGPYTLKVFAADEAVPDDKHEATGRSAFRIHGDSVRMPGTASHGCIILPRTVRQRIWESGDYNLEVVA